MPCCNCRRRTLYFLEKTAPRLQPWQRELLRIVRHHRAIFLSAAQTKVMNEGCATYVHYEIMNRLHEKGQITDGAMLEFLHSHTNVVFQPDFDDPRYTGINPYALGFAMMRDIERICHRADRRRSRSGSPPSPAAAIPMAVLRDVWANYRDESFILQFLSPRLIRELGLFHVLRRRRRAASAVEAIHDERGYRKIQRALARQYDSPGRSPISRSSMSNLAGDRRLILHHRAPNRILLEERDARFVLQHLADLWGYDVLLKEIDPANDAVLKEHAATPRGGILQPDGSC